MYISMDNEKDFDHWMKLATVSAIIMYCTVYKHIYVPLACKILT